MISAAVKKMVLFLIVLPACLGISAQQPEAARTSKAKLVYSGTYTNAEMGSLWMDMLRNELYFTDNKNNRALFLFSAERFVCPVR